MNPWDKIRTLEMLAKHFALLTDRHVIGGGLTLEQLVTASYEYDSKKKRPGVRLERPFPRRSTA